MYSGLVLVSASVALAAGTVRLVDFAIGVPISVGASFLYFWLLDRMEHLSTPWWATLLVGFVVLVFVV